MRGPGGICRRQTRKGQGSTPPGRRGTEPSVGAEPQTVTQWECPQGPGAAAAPRKSRPRSPLGHCPPGIWARGLGASIMFGDWSFLSLPPRGRTTPACQGTGSKWQSAGHRPLPSGPSFQAQGGCGVPGLCPALPPAGSEKVPGAFVPETTGLHRQAGQACPLLSSLWKPLLLG